jgi:ADP-heptose:LPS heptosyltransferase
MINRTINVKLLEPLFNIDNVQFYSFQVTDTFKGNEKYPQMINLAKGFKNFDDTAKAMKSLDLIISVDTSVAHLAGALGVKTFLMLPYTSDWRWFEDTKTTPWYDSVEIFKQIDPISWEQPIEDIICKLKEYSS